MLDSGHSATRNEIELASRESGTLRVALLWRRELDLVAVLVTDSATDESFELVVDRHALEVYYHPYAYAALRGVEFRVAA